MAPESGFSKGWNGFVDHKWSKNRLGTLFAILSLQATLPRILVRERLFPKVSKRPRPLAARVFSTRAAGKQTGGGLEEDLLGNGRIWMRFA
jgi:hypothetical protein